MSVAPESVEITSGDVVYATHRYPLTMDAFRTTGLLWLLNAAVLHPRGYALCLGKDEDDAEFFAMLGDGTEVWSFGDDVDDEFRAVDELLRNVTARPKSTEVDQ